MGITVVGGRASRGEDGNNGCRWAGEPHYGKNLSPKAKTEPHAATFLEIGRYPPWLWHRARSARSTGLMANYNTAKASLLAKSGQQTRHTHVGAVLRRV